MWRKLLDVLFWLGISLYFGGMVTVGAIVAPAVFDTAKQTGLTMPHIESPPLEMDRQVGGEIFGAILNRFAYIEAAALGLLLVAIAGWILSHSTVRRSTWIIAIFWVLLAGLLTYDAAWLRPHVWSIRESVRNTALAHATDKSDASWPERAEFDALHKRSEDLGKAKVYLLLGMLLAASWRSLIDGPASKLAKPTHQAK